MRVVLSVLARQELNEARRYLDKVQPGLGNRLADEVRTAAARITRFPLAYPVQLGEIRKCLLHRFPYKLLYAVRADRIVVVAVAHQHRHPDYWVERIGKPG